MNDELLSGRGCFSSEDVNEAVIPVRLSAVGFV